MPDQVLFVKHCLKRAWDMKGRYFAVYLLPLLLATISYIPTTAQSSGVLETDVRTQRILFIFDASRSMINAWDGETMFDVGREMLVEKLDSLEKANPNIQFALRIYGHQSDKPLENCEDSKLEVPFGDDNTARIKKKLRQVQPRGWTPIAYSLYQALNDFPHDSKAKNIIILITDGIESCDGDPCSMSEQFQQKGIALKPFIVGMGLSKTEQLAFDCFEQYFDAQDKHSYSMALNAAIHQALHKTSTQVNLLDNYGKATQTNVSMTFYDHYTGKVMYNLVHAIQDGGKPDTLYLSPIYRYDLVVHTIPPVHQKNIELVPGKHNIIGMDAPQGYLHFSASGRLEHAETAIQCVLRKPTGGALLAVQDINTQQKYRTGQYQVDVLTVPRIRKTIYIEQDRTTDLTIPPPGTLRVFSELPGIGSVYMVQDEKYEKVYEFEVLKGQRTLSLQPGEYRFVYRPQHTYESEHTREKSFTITSNSRTNIRF